MQQINLFINTPFEKKTFHVHGNVLPIKKVEHKDNFIFNAKSLPVFNYPRNRFVQIKTKSCNNVSTTMHSA